MDVRILARIFGAVAFATAMPGLVSAQIPAETPAYFRPGDQIQIQVWGQQNYSGQFRINESGRIAHPIYQQIVAAGLPLSEIEASVRALLEREVLAEPRFSIDGTFRVAVAGRVRQPSVHDLRPGMTVSEVIAMTGGLSDGAALDKVRLRRDGYDYQLDLTDLTSNARFVTIRSGDEILVPGSRSILRDYVGPVSSVLSAVFLLVRINDRAR